MTGGAKGIGRAVAERLRDAGAAVWVWDIAPAELDGIRSVAVDVTSADQIARAVAQVVDETSRIDILVNNAGYLPSASPFEQLDPESWKRVVAVNLMGMLEASRQALPYLRRADKGRIVNLGSLAGKEGLRNLSVYSAASAGVIAFTKALGEGVGRHPDPRELRRAGSNRHRPDQGFGTGDGGRHDRGEPDEAPGHGRRSRRTDPVAVLRRLLVQHGRGVRSLRGAGPHIRARIERFQATWTRFAVEKRSKKQDKESIPRQGNAGSFGSRLFEDGERLVAMFGEVLLALDGTVPPASMDGEGGVSQGGEGLGGVAGSGAAGVLAAGPIADVVQAVLDSPMPSRDVEQ